jgi:hypothetical protein
MEQRFQALLDFTTSSSVLSFQNSSKWLLDLISQKAVA